MIPVELGTKAEQYLYDEPDPLEADAEQRMGPRFLLNKADSDQSKMP